MNKKAMNKRYEVQRLPGGKRKIVVYHPRRGAPASMVFDNYWLAWGKKRSLESQEAGKTF